MKMFTLGTKTTKICILSSFFTQKNNENLLKNSIIFFDKILTFFNLFYFKTYQQNLS